MNTSTFRSPLRRLRCLMVVALTTLFSLGGWAADPSPLPFAPVVKYFAKVTGARPWKVHDQCIVFSLSEPSVAKDHHECLIMVTADPNRLAVSFLVSGEFGMNFVREFFESPFFGASETAAFYATLGTPPGSTTYSADRFTVEITRAETPEWMFLSMSFGPPSRATPEPTPLNPRPAPAP